MIANYRAKNLIDRHLFEIDEDRERISFKFERARENYELAKEKLTREYLSLHKTPRMLTTCPSALKRLVTKGAQNCEHVSLNDHVVDQQCHSTSVITFTSDFVKYYFERETKIPQYFKEVNNLRRTQTDLTAQESELREQYENVI